MKQLNKFTLTRSLRATFALTLLLLTLLLAACSDNNKPTATSLATTTDTQATSATGAATSTPNPMARFSSRLCQLQPTVWTVPPPQVDPADARLELARRYLHTFGPTTPEAFAEWAGIGRRRCSDAFGALRRSLTRVRTPVGDAWILTRDEPTFRASPGPVASARLLPSGDAYFLLQGDDRELLVADADRRRALWTPRVWPGGLLVEGELVGTWRRSQGTVTIQTWRRLSRAARDAVEAEAHSLPLPDIPGGIVVRWG